jgi:multidrug efflux system outer membrane protein
MLLNLAYLSLFLFLFLEGCQLGPKYERPFVNTPNSWKNTTNTIENSPPVDNWWEIFNDVSLNELEVLAVNQNYRLNAAYERVIQAKDRAGIIRSRLYPQINLLPSYNNQAILSKIFNRNKNANVFTQNTANIDQKNLIREHQMLYALPLSLSYEVDLWGRIKSEYQSAVLQAQAQAEDYNTILLVLTTDLAIAYFQLRTQDNLIHLLDLVIKTRRKALEITTVRYEEKISDYSPVALAELELSNSIYQYEDAQRIRALYENQIAVLIGISASEFSIPSELILVDPPQIPFGIPSEILMQRPDLAEKELQMAAIHKQIGVAYASYFPSIQLTAGLGFSSPASNQFVKWKSRYWQFGSDISQYVFDAGARDFNVHMTWAEFQEASSNYQERVLEAFEEVENALSNLEMLKKEMEAAQTSVKAANKAYELALERYRDGVTYYLEVVDTERQELQYREIYTNLLGLRYANTVQLIKSLGGTWKNSENQECY